MQNVSDPKTTSSKTNTVKTTLYLCENVFDSVKAMVKQLHEKNMRMILLLNDENSQTEYSQKFWNDRTFLPHSKEIDEWIKDNPILILRTEQLKTLQDYHYESNLNQADVCIISDHVIINHSAEQQSIQKMNIKRILYMIPAHNESLQALVKNEYQIEDTYRNTQGKWHAVK